MSLGVGLEDQLRDVRGRRPRNKLQPSQKYSKCRCGGILNGRFAAFGRHIGMG